MNACDAFIFAAGIGSRLRPHTEKVPKPCIPLFSIPLGYYVLPYLAELGVQKSIVNTFHLPEQIKTQYQFAIPNVLFSDEVGFIKGSAGGLKQAENLFSNAESIIAMNADEVFFAKNASFLKEALEHHHKVKNFATLVVMKHPGVGKEFGGIWCDGSRIIDINKKEPTELKLRYPNLAGWHFIGFQILSKEALTFIKPGVEQNIFYDILISHLQTHKCEIFPVEGDWYETGSVPDYLKAKQTIQGLKESDSRYRWLFSRLEKYPKSPHHDLG